MTLPRPFDLAKFVSSYVRAARDCRQLENLLQVPLGSLTRYLPEIGFDIGFFFHLARQLKDAQRLKEFKKWSWPPRHLLVLYALVRLRKPRVLLESGVGPGSSTAFILRALQRNGSGKLVSLDLPERGSSANELAVGFSQADPPGWLIHPSTRERWDLRLVDARVELPRIVAELKPIDMFLHDSLHTYEHMHFEYSNSVPAISAAGLLLSDDVALPGRPAFLDFCRSRKIPFEILGNRFGVGLVRGGSDRGIAAGATESVLMHHLEGKGTRNERPETAEEFRSIAAFEGQGGSRVVRSLVCDRCSGYLTRDTVESSARCQSCEREIPFVDGFLDFVGQPTPYWGEIPEERIQMALTTARSRGIDEALAEIATEYPELGIYILSWARADWIFHWLSSSRSLDLCVDLGSGWGTLTLALSAYFRDVISVDIVPQRLSIQSLRLEHESIKNVSLIRASALETPVRTHTADLVVANGLLEWMALAKPDANVAKTQLEFLRACKAMLKPDGSLVIGIENRIGLNSLVGFPDHSGYPFTSLLPRFVAAGLVRLGDLLLRPPLTTKRSALARGRYLTWTYTIPGYVKLLRRAGFRYVEVYWCYPSYNLAKFSGSLADRESVAEFAKWTIESGGRAIAVQKRLLAEALAYSPRLISQCLAWSLWPNILLLASQEKRGAQAGGMIPISDGIKMSGPHRHQGTVSSMKLKRGKLTRLTRFSRFPLHADQSEGSGVERVGALTFQVEHADVKEARAFDIFSRQDNRKLLDWLEGFQNAASRDRLDRTFLATELAYLESSREFASFSSRVKARVRSDFEGLLGHLKAADYRVVPEHGDLWYGNILVEPSGEISVIDWEYSRQHGVQPFDFFFHLITSMMAGQDPVASFSSNLDGEGPYSTIAKSNLDDFSRRQHLATGDLTNWITYVLVRATVQHSPRQRGWSPSYVSFREILEKWPFADHRILS